MCKCSLCQICNFFILPYHLRHIYQNYIGESLLQQHIILQDNNLFSCHHEEAETNSFFTNVNS